MQIPDEQERTLRKQHLRKLNRALTLLSQETPAPDMPLQVAAILREVISAWTEIINAEQLSLKADLPETPDLDTLMAWMDEGVCEATDGCLVEPDGRCPHGNPSWLLEMGLI